MRLQGYCISSPIPYSREGGAKHLAYQFLSKANTSVHLELSLRAGTEEERCAMSRDIKGVREIKKGEVYEINFQLDGHRMYRRVRAKSLPKAYDLRVMEKVKYASREPVENITFEAMKHRLEVRCEADGNNIKTMKNLMSKFKTFYEDFLSTYYPSVRNINQISKIILESYKAYVVVSLKRKYGWRDEITKQRSIASKLIDAGVCEQKTYDNVFKKVPKPKRREKLYKDISSSQKKSLLEYFKKYRPDLYGITYLIMRLGWRREQTMSIKKSNIKLRGLTPIAIKCGPEYTKTKKPHILDEIDNEIAKVIKAYYFCKDNKTDWLFPNKNGKRHHLNHYTSYIGKISEKVLDMRVTPHDFRHDFVTKMKAMGYADRDIMAITGHEDIGSFQIYQHATGIGTKKVLESSRLF